MGKTIIAPLIEGQLMTACAYSAALRNRVTGAVVAVSSLILLPGHPDLTEKDFHALGDRRVLEKMSDPEINKVCDAGSWDIISRHIEFTTVGFKERE